MVVTQATVFSSQEYQCETAEEDEVCDRIVTRMKLHEMKIVMIWCYAVTMRVTVSLYKRDKAYGKRLYH